MARWGPRLAAQSDEATSLALLADFGLAVAKSQTCETERELADAAVELGFPVALKTAEAGIDHKSDRGGVVLNIVDQPQLQQAYRDLSDRLGPRVLLQKMASRGTELSFGCLVDPDFGPLVMVAPGGTLVELFPQRRFALAPVSALRAEAMIRDLPVAKLMTGYRGAPRQDIKAAAESFAAFSQACATLAPWIKEIDVNPVVVSETGVLAVDALLVPAEQATLVAAK